MTTYYTRKQVIELLEIDDGFLVALEQEEVVTRDAPAGTGEFSEQMLERARVAHTLVRDLDVNLPGVAVIVRLREEVSGLRRRLEQVLGELQRGGSGR